MTDNLFEKDKKSFRFAFEGLAYALKTQRNFRLQLVLGLWTIILAISFGFNQTEWLFLIFSICLVLSAELANTVVEVVVDLVTDKIHPKAKLAKDLSAGIVLLISIFVLIIGLLLFLPHVLNLLI